MLWLLFLYLNVVFIPSGGRDWRKLFFSSSLRAARWLAGPYMDNGCLLVCTQTSLSQFYRVQRILSWSFPASLSFGACWVRRQEGGGRKGTADVNKSVFTLISFLYTWPVLNSWLLLLLLLCIYVLWCIIWHCIHKHDIIMTVNLVWRLFLFGYAFIYAFIHFQGSPTLISCLVSRPPTFPNLPGARRGPGWPI